MAVQKRKAGRAAARKVKDKWKAKQWYTVRAPRMFNGVPIAETLADEEEKLIGRVAEATLQELTGDFSKMHVKIRFKVNAVKGTDCGTKFVGHELTSDYVRRLTRRKHSKIDGVFDVRTSDGFRVRVKPMAITERRAQASQEYAIRQIAERICKETAARNDVAGFLKDIVAGELSSAIYKEARKIYPLKRVEIRKSELVSEPEGAEEFKEVFAPSAEEIEAARAAEAGEAEAPEEAEESAEEAPAEAEAEEAPAEEELTEEERVE